MKKEMLTPIKTLRLVAIRIALVAVRLPLRIASYCTWQLESWQSRLQTAIHTLANDQ